MLEMLPMASKPKPPNDRHRFNRMIRLNPDFDGLLTYLCMKRAQKMTQVVNEALRRELEREGLWPITDEVRAKLKDSSDYRLNFQ